MNKYDLCLSIIIHQNNLKILIIDDKIINFNKDLVSKNFEFLEKFDNETLNLLNYSLQVFVNNPFLFNNFNNYYSICNSVTPNTFLQSFKDINNIFKFNIKPINENVGISYSLFYYYFHLRITPNENLKLYINDIYSNPRIQNMFSENLGASKEITNLIKQLKTGSKNDTLHYNIDSISNIFGQNCREYFLNIHGKFIDINKHPYIIEFLNK